MIEEWEHESMIEDWEHEWMNAQMGAKTSEVETLHTKIKELQDRIDRALQLGRWHEWGDRAEMCEQILRGE